MDRIAIVGAGPAGFFTAQQLLRSCSNPIHISIIEKKLTPFGLVRYGVAPDHPEVKNVIQKFTTTMNLPNITYLGNVTVGSDITVSQLKENFDAVIIASGSSSDRELGIPGENSLNVLSGRDFVGWYNGDPDHCESKVKLDAGDTAIVLGQGNVALDCARILLAGPEVLEKTDISPYALQALKSSTIKKVHVVGRRGLIQASFTSKEVREMMALENVAFITPDASILEQVDSNKAFLSQNRPKKRLMDIIIKGSPKSLHECEKTWQLDFLSTPTRIIQNKLGYVEAIEFEQNELVNQDANELNPIKAKARGTGSFFQKPCSLVIKCVGYQNNPVSGLPFDPKSSIIPSIRGRVLLDGEESPSSNVYVAGWIKTGPVGVLTSTLFDANETAFSVLEDLKKIDSQTPEKLGILL